MISAREVQRMPLKKLVACPSWQVVRGQMIGKWMNRHPMNIDALRKHLDRHVEGVGQGWDDPATVRRVLNVLVGTVHRIGYLKPQPETDKLRREVRIVWAQMCNEPPYMGDGSMKDWKGVHKA